MMLTIVLIQVTLLFRFVQSEMDETTPDANLTVTNYNNITELQKEEYLRRKQIFMDIIARLERTWPAIPDANVWNTRSWDFDHRFYKTTMPLATLPQNGFNFEEITIGENYFWGTHGCRWYPECRYDNLMFNMLSATWFIVLVYTIILVCMQRKLLTMGTALVHLERTNHDRARWINATLCGGNGSPSFEIREMVQATERMDESERQSESNNSKALIPYNPDTERIEKTITVSAEETLPFQEHSQLAIELWAATKDITPVLFETDSKENTKESYFEDDNTNTREHYSHQPLGNIEKACLYEDQGFPSPQITHLSVLDRDSNKHHLENTTVCVGEPEKVVFCTDSLNEPTKTNLNIKTFGDNELYEHRFISTSSMDDDVYDCVPGKDGFIAGGSDYQNTPFDTPKENKPDYCNTSSKTDHHLAIDDANYDSVPGIDGSNREDSAYQNNPCSVDGFYQEGDSCIEVNISAARHSRFSENDNEHVRGELELDICAAPTSVEESLSMIYGNIREYMKTKTPNFEEDTLAFSVAVQQENLHEVTNNESHGNNNSEEIEILSTSGEPKSSTVEQCSGDSYPNIRDNIDTESKEYDVTSPYQPEKYNHENKNIDTQAPDTRFEEEIHKSTTEIEPMKNPATNRKYISDENEELITTELCVSSRNRNNQFQVENHSETLNYVPNHEDIEKDNALDECGLNKIPRELEKEVLKEHNSDRSGETTERLSGAVDGNSITDDHVMEPKFIQRCETDLIFLKGKATPDANKREEYNAVGDYIPKETNGSKTNSKRGLAQRHKRSGKFIKRKPQKTGRSCVQTWSGKLSESLSIIKEKVARKEKIAVNAGYHLLKSSHSEPHLSQTHTPMTLFQHKDIFRNIEPDQAILSLVRRRNNYAMINTLQVENTSYWYKMLFKLNIFFASYYARTSRSNICSTVDSVTDSGIFVDTKQIKDFNYQAHKEKVFEEKWYTEMARYLYNPDYFKPQYVQIFAFPANNQQNPTNAESACNYWFRLISLATYEGACSIIRLAQNGFIHEEQLGPYSTRCYRCSLVYSNWEYFDDILSIHRRLSPDCPLLRDAERSSQDRVADDIMAHASSSIANGTEAEVTQSSERVDETSASGNVVTGTRSDGNSKDDKKDQENLEAGSSKLGLIENSENAQILIETFNKLDISPASPEENPTELEEIKRGNAELRDKLTCKICLDRLVLIILIPCGHWCCRTCAWGIRKCHVCRSRILERFMPV